ncbi:hypothetical protein TSUD_167030 [Trifolium subterraneum]|nr:hypothetical protein TSUD_167030 [Trifolium subterraneum]
MASSSETPSSQPQSQEASSAQSLVERNVRRKTDITWAHCKLLPNNKISCMYCNKIIGGGGIHRVKEHLAGIPGNTEICKDVPPEVRFLLKQNYDENSKKRKNSQVAESDSAAAEEEPLVRVLRIVDSEDKPAMGYLYRAIYKAREEIEKRFKRNKLKVEPYLKILDNRWDAQLRKNLHAAGYWLNPSCRFSPEYENHETTTSGLLDVIEKYAYDSRDLRTKLTAEMRSFRNCEGSFGRKTAIEDRTEVLPDQWWEMYGTEAPNLKKLAIRILSQTCSASGCERNWSVFEHIHSKKRNRLEHQKLNDLVFVRYNLRLQNRNKKKQNYDPINFETLDDHSDWVLEDSPPFLTIEEVEALRNDLANMTIQPLSNDIDQLNLDEVEDDAQLGENVEQSNNIVDDPDAFDVDAFDLGEPNIDTTLPPWN